jgi:hypothetical protein
MEAILVRRFDPFNFFVVPGFPNVVPTIDEWGDFLPIFREHVEFLYLRRCSSCVYAILDTCEMYYTLCALYFVSNFTLT